MSDPLGWWLVPTPVGSLPRRVFQTKKHHNSIPGAMFGITDYHWSTAEADRLLPNGFVFCYLTPAHKLGLIDIDGGVRQSIPCPDTWEEALAWLRMTCELVQT